MDEDNLHDEPFEFGWFCENTSGGACVSRTGEALLGLASGVDEAILYIAAGSIPIGELPGRCTFRPRARFRSDLTELLLGVLATSNL